jgi:hypothetical protein
MSDPDVEHAGWAVGGPGSRLRRTRNPLLLVLAGVLIVAGVAASVVGIVLLIIEGGPQEEKILAAGKVAALDGRSTRAATFTTAGDEKVTVWLRAGGASNVRDSIVAGTSCAIVRADGTTDAIRGSRQGTSVAVDRYATIGVFRSAPGANAVTCRHVPFGRRRNRNRLREERPFVVERGSPASGMRGMLLLFPGIGVALAGIPVAQRWRAGRLRPA